MTHAHEPEGAHGDAGHRRGLGSRRTVVHVGGGQPYDVIIGEHISHELPDLVAGASKAAVIFTASVGHDASHAVHELIDAGIEVTPITLPDAEAAKSIEVAARCWDALAANGFTRSDVVVGVGGGALTDLAGFVAATWLRGVRWVPVATSINGMVDAAVGGKTGINIGAGKNLVGSFHPPAGVLCELTALKSLPKEQRNAGLAEVVKCGLIADPVILELLSKPDENLPELIERSVRVKADVVAGDLREAGRREILNYGHTLGHAIENVENYTWSHGHAISVGLVYAAYLGRLTGRPDFVERTKAQLSDLGLPVTYNGDWAALRTAMSLDKKSRGKALRFVLLDDLAEPVTVPIDDETLLQRAYEDLRA
jgi:3-dehydroquinate synthase